MGFRLPSPTLNFQPFGNMGPLPIPPQVYPYPVGTPHFTFGTPVRCSYTILNERIHAALR